MTVGVVLLYLLNVLYIESPGPSGSVVSHNLHIVQIPSSDTEIKNDTAKYLVNRKFVLILCGIAIEKMCSGNWSFLCLCVTHWTISIRQASDHHFFVVVLQNPHPLSF